MKKITFLQIPEENNFSIKETSRNHFNTPVFCGYALGLLNRSGFKNLTGELFGVGFTDIAGDQMIFNKLAESRPDILWIPLLSEGNYQRCVYIAGKMKEINPNLKVVAAGPEIPFSAGEFFPEGIDIGIFSQKTKTVVELFENFNKDTIDLSKIKGIIYRKNGKLFTNRMDENFPSIKDLPSPYLSGALTSVLNFPRIWMETRRGCPNRCLYCYHGRLEGNNESFFTLARVKAELEYFKNNNAPCISIMDPTFNSPFEWTEKICKLIYSVNKDRKIRFESNLRCDLVDGRQADLFQKCGFVSFTTGLQSTDMRALKKISRKNEFKKLLNGIKLLHGRGITVYPDIIIGLPGDDLNSFKQTVNFLVAADMAQFSKSFILFVPPVSRLWNKAKSLGIKFQAHPPHLLLNSPSFSFECIKEGINYAAGRGCEIIPKPFRTEEYNHPQMVTGINSNYPNSGYLWQKGENLKDADLPISRLIIELDAPSSAEKLYSLAEKCAGIIASAAVLWFKGKNLAQKTGIIKNILKTISAPNPYTVWNIVLESDYPVNKKFIDEIESSIIYLPHNLDYQAIFLADSPGAGYYRAAAKFYVVYKNCRGVLQYAPTIKYHFYRSLNLSKSDSVENKIKQALAEECEGCLFEFDGNFDILAVKKIMAFIHTNNWKKKIITFRDWHLQILWDKHFDQKQTTEGEEEKILYLNREGNLLFAGFKK